MVRGVQRKYFQRLACMSVGYLAIVGMEGERGRRDKDIPLYLTRAGSTESAALEMG